MKAAKIASGLAIASLLLTSSVALAQTQTTPGGSGVNNTTGTGSNMNTGTTNDTSTNGTSNTSTSNTSGATSNTTGSSSVPGAPNTGTGGDGATTALLVGVAALIALGGIAYLARNTMTSEQ
ncbi:hypothetical protein KW798_00345 [Candidatus Parcubacteria bacterium]|nr:hypothetical protein [Candidatus Parcubacteria bacterium]